MYQMIVYVSVDSVIHILLVFLVRGKSVMNLPLLQIYMFEMEVLKMEVLLRISVKTF